MGGWWVPASQLGQAQAGWLGLLLVLVLVPAALGQLQGRMGHFAAGALQVHRWPEC